jgi:hypothetical protein
LGILFLAPVFLEHATALTLSLLELNGALFSPSV